MYEQMRPSFVEWAESMVLSDSAEEAGMHEFTSVTGLYTLQLPANCFVIDDSTTPASLAAYGLEEEDAQLLLDEMRSRPGVQDVIVRTDLGAVLAVTVDPEAGLTQAEMVDREEDLYIDEALENENYSYEGIVKLDDNPNLFYLIRIDHGDYEEFGFVTYHDDVGASVTFSFSGFTEDEARQILSTLDMLQRSE